MKKLLTLFALLAVFLGVKAVEVVDAEINYSWYNDISEVPFASWRGSASAFERLSIQDGCLHFESVEATDPSWDCQFYPIGIGNSAEEGVTYTLHYKMRGDHVGNVSLLGFGQTPYGQFQITDEWVEGTVTYESTSTDGNLLMQCGDWVGTWDIAYLKITHELKDEQPGELIEEYSIDYSGYRAFPFYVMDYVPEWNDGIMTDFGAQYLYKKITDVTEVDNVVGEVYAADGTVYNKIKLDSLRWHQYFLATDVNTEIGGHYIVQAQVRASETCNVQLNLGDWGSSLNSSAVIPESTEFQIVEWEFKSVPVTSSFIIAQPGTSTATIEWQSVTVYHYKDGGEIQPKETIDIYPNPTEVVVYGKERDDLADYADEIREEEGGTGQTWDNQFAIVANRPLKAGEKTIISFKYKASTYAKTTTQCHGASLGAYMYWAAIGDVNFDTEWQEFEKTFTIPTEADGMQTLAFNMAEIKEACDYHISNIVWKLADDTETLINMEGEKCK